MDVDSILTGEEFGVPFAYTTALNLTPEPLYRPFDAKTFLSMWEIAGVGSISSQESLSSPSVVMNPGAQPTSISSAESVSDITVNVTIYPDELASFEVVSNPLFMTDSKVDSVLSEEFVSDVSIVMQLLLFPGSITTGFAAGTVTVNTTVNATSIASAEAFGSVTLSTPLFVTPTSIASAESVSDPRANYILLALPSSIGSAEAVSDVAANAVINVSPLYDDSAISNAGVSLTYMVDGADPTEEVSDLYTNYRVVAEMDSADSSSAVQDISAELIARIRPTSAVTQEVFGLPEVGLNSVVQPASIESAERLPKAYVHHPISDLSVNDGSAVPEVNATLQSEPAYPLSILSEELVNNVNAVIEGVINPYALSSDGEFGFASVLISAHITAESVSESEEFGEVSLGLSVTRFDADSIASEEQVSEATITDVFIRPKAFDRAYSDQPLSVENMYGDDTVDRVWDGEAWQWEVANSYYYSNYTWVRTWITYDQKWVTDGDGGHWEPITIENTSLKEKFDGMSRKMWSELIYAHQLPWYQLSSHYYGQLEDWILHGLNVERPVSTTGSGATTNQIFGEWHVDSPIGELVDSSPGGSEVVITNLSVIDDRIAELRGSSPAGIITAGVPQQVYATISAVTAEATDTFASTAEYVIEDKVANYDLYEGVSVSPAVNYIFKVPEPTYIQGIPVVPSIRTDPLCFVDIIAPALKISRDSSGKLEFFGVAPDVYGETVTSYDTVDDLPPTLYRPLRPPRVLPEDPTSDWEEPDPYDLPDIPDTWDGWEPEETDDPSGDSDDGWEETDDGVTPGTQTRYKDFPLNLYGGGTVIMSGIPKYKNNGKKKWLFATGKKRKKPDPEGNCVDEEIDDGPRYIGLYIKNGKLVLTDGEYVLRCSAPPRGQRALVFAGYYGKKSYVGWWKNPKKYSYRMGEMVDKGQSNKGVTTIMIGRGWGLRSAADNAGDGFTIGSIQIIDETITAGSAGTNPNLTTPTSTLQGIAYSTVSPTSTSDDNASTSDSYVLDPNNPNNAVLKEISEQIREVNDRMKEISDNLRAYPNMPSDQRDAGNASLAALSAVRDQLREDYQTRAALAPPHWVSVNPEQTDEYKKYMADYSKWKYQPRMIGYFSINDTSRVGVPGVS